MIFETSVRRPISTIMVLMMVVVLGFSSMIGLPRALMPNIELPVAMAMVTYPGAGPEEIETMVTEPIERQFASLEGLDTMMSMTYEGVALIMIQFTMDTDMNFATLEMREKMSLAQMFFPDEVGNPTIMKMSMDAMPVMQVYVSGDMDLAELNDIVADNLMPQFERLEGVASVTMSGGTSEEIAIEFEQEKLAGYGLTLANLSSILVAENISLPSGNVTKGSSEIIVRTIGEFESIEEIKNLPITATDRSIIRLGDLATVVRQDETQESISRIDGRQSIGIFIYKSSDGNVVKVSDEVLGAVQKLETTFPQIKMVVGFDQADYIRSSLSSVMEAALLGAILAVIVIFLFLRNVRSTLVIAISIPTSVLFTFALMNAMGLTLNLFTLCALTLAIGMLVDNSVVVLENIFRTGKLGLTPMEAAIKGSKEVFLPIVASTLTSVVVFLPIALSGGISGMMFKEFCLTIVIALFASLIVAMTAVPMLSSKLLDSSVSEDYIGIRGHFYRYRIVPYFTRFMKYVTDSYEQFSSYSLKHTKKILAGCLAIFVLSIGLVAIVGMEMLPASDEGSLTVTVGMPYGTSLAEKEVLMSEIEEYILSLPELEHATLSIGQSDMMGSVDSSTISVVLTGKTERSKSTADIVKEIRKEFADVVGAEITVEESSTMGMMMGTSDIEINLLGKSVEDLQAIADDVTGMIAGIRGVDSVEPSTEEGNPEVVVRIDRNRAAHYGITAYQLASGLSQSLGGTTATQFKVGGDEIDINLSLSDEYGASIENMKQIMITSAMGTQVPVGQIAQFEFDNSPSVIYRLNQENVITLAVDVEGRDLPDVSKEIEKIMQSYTFPEGTYYDSSGTQEEMMEAFGNLLLALVISVALVYLILAMQFESIILPIMIMVSIPFAMSGAFLALFLTGTKLSMTSFIGLIMLIGIVVNNSILLVEFIKINKEKMSRNVAIVQAGVVRLRPILMTTLSTCIGMIPISIAIGEGTEMLAPMGISIIGGLAASTLVTLIIIPVLYAFVDDIETKNREKREKRKEVRKRMELDWLAKEAKKHGETQDL